MKKEYLEKIKEFYKKRRRMPSYSEIARLLKFKSKASAYKLVQKLIDKGILERDDAGKILPGQLDKGIKILGLVEAGFPSPAEEELVDTMSLDEYLVENKESTFILQVKGDSMVGAGINDGDLVLVDRKKEAKPGHIVVAEVDGEWTLKYLRKSGRKIYLEAANEKYKPIYPEEDLNIAAVVKALVRKY